MQNNDASVCPLCRHEKIKIFAVGECSHPVCHLCSTKMRVLCEQTYCAICRQELPRVYFVSDLSLTQPTIDESRFTPIDETGECGIYYPIKTDWIRRETEKLLRNFCPFCYSEYETFEVLREHVRRTHRYFYCDLCVEHLNLFPHERKCYTRHDLVQHMRCGDRDDKSFRGHPLCRFCDDHFLDVDELYKHMRKEHYYCHLCTNDNVYYSDFDLLRDHYRSNHYLCEIGQCKNVQFTNVFSSEIDFRAHQAAQHSKNRAEARQLGTIPVEFQSSSTRDRRQQHDPAHRGTFRGGEFKTQGNNNSSKTEREETQQEPAVPVAVPSIDEFPTLGERSSTPQHFSQQRGAWTADSSRQINSLEAFPALPSAATNVSSTNSTQNRGIWRDQPTSSSSSSLSSLTNNTTKKATQPVKPPNDRNISVNMAEDFPALQGASNKKILAPVSMFSAWSTAKKAAKTAGANAKANQPQLRVNVHRLMGDDDEDECIRRPMASLTTSTAPTASANITLISSSDLPNNQKNEKPHKTKNQSLPDTHDFPALPSASTTVQNNAVSSSVWVAKGPNSSTESSKKQHKKKDSATSKKKFLEEVQAISPTPPPLSSTTDFPTIGLNQLGQSLMTAENQTNVVPTVNEEKPSSSLPVSHKQEKNNEKKSTNQSNKKKSTTKNTNDLIKEEPMVTKEKAVTKQSSNQVTSQPLVKDETRTQTDLLPTSSIQSPSNIATPVPIPPPPGFSVPLDVAPPPGFSVPLDVPPPPPPPGFNTLAASQPTPPTYVFPPSYLKQKDEFRAKLFHLFDGDMNLFTEYDRFCEAFVENQITTKDFIAYTKQLFKDKMDEYLLELIVIMPNIERQNELYAAWKKDIDPKSSYNKKNWMKKDSDENNIHVCRVCQQIMFESDIENHNSNHTEFNTQFPSLPAAAVSLGRGKGKKNK